jgi:hypothetical protein
VSKPVIHVPLESDEILLIQDALHLWEKEQLRGNERESQELMSLVKRLGDCYKELSEYSGESN